NLLEPCFERLGGGGGRNFRYPVRGGWRRLVHCLLGKRKEAEKNSQPLHGVESLQHYEVSADLVLAICPTGTI
ncbi:MAG TPA: hypothetical protein VK955_07075, partial [Xanthobacteraceae bacterium]|nr:hypothetical protein [Xanthobacteraceae bacterium]